MRQRTSRLTKFVVAGLLSVLARGTLAQDALDITGKFTIFDVPGAR
jgi:hypothetical protein